MIPVDLMVPTTVATLPLGDAWVYEPKWDGYRAAAMKVGEVQIVSRRGTDLTEVFPDLATALRDAVPDGTLLDTEVVVYRDGRLSFDALQQRMSHGPHQAARLARSEPASLVVFDIMLDAGEDVRSLSWDQRRHRLDSIGSAVAAAVADHPLHRRPGHRHGLDGVAGADGDRRDRVQAAIQPLRQPRRLDQDQVPRNSRGRDRSRHRPTGPARGADRRHDQRHRRSDRARPHHRAYRRPKPPTLARCSDHPTSRIPGRPSWEPATSVATR